LLHLFILVNAYTIVYCVTSIVFHNSNVFTVFFIKKGASSSCR